MDSYLDSVLLLVLLPLGAAEPHIAATGEAEASFSPTQNIKEGSANGVCNVAIKPTV